MCDHRLLGSKQKICIYTIYIYIYLYIHHTYIVLYLATASTNPNCGATGFMGMNGIGNAMFRIVDGLAFGE